MDGDRKHHTKSERTSIIWYHLSKKWGSDRLTDTENKSTVTKGKRDQRKDKLGYPSRKNPVDQGAWWAAVHEVAQSRTRLKRLSSNSSSRQEYWSGLPCPCPGDLPNPGTEPGFPALAGGFFTGWATREALLCFTHMTEFNPSKTLRRGALKLRRSGVKELAKSHATWKWQCPGAFNAHHKPKTTLGASLSPSHHLCSKFMFQVCQLTLPLTSNPTFIACSCYCNGSPLSGGAIINCTSRGCKRDTGGGKGLGSSFHGARLHPVSCPGSLFLPPLLPSF